MLEPRLRVLPVDRDELPDDDLLVERDDLPLALPLPFPLLLRDVVREEEERLEDSARRYNSGEADTSPRWEGMGVGIGRPRQGTSADPGRHADPKPVLEERRQREEHMTKAAADDLTPAERRSRATEEIEGDRTGGSPIAPSGVPKGDHVADPSSADPILREQTGRVTRAD